MYKSENICDLFGFRAYRQACPICNEKIWPRCVALFFWNVNNVENQANRAAIQQQAPLAAAQAPVSVVPMHQLQAPAEMPVVQARVFQVPVVRAHPVRRRRRTLNANDQVINPQRPQPQQPP